jgi:glutaredoxin 3
METIIYDIIKITQIIQGGRKMAEKKVLIYSTPTCPYCKRAKDYLTQKGISYTDYDVAKDRDKAKEMIDKSKQMGVPVIIVDGEVVVGFNQAKLDGLLS